MKTRIIFKGYGSDQSYQIDTIMKVQPHDKTVMSFADVDGLPGWVSMGRWYVQDSRIFFIGNAADPTREIESRMEIVLKLAL